MSPKIEDVDTFAESLKGGQLVKIYIGPKDEDSMPFMIQHTTLCQRSKYFRSALEGAFEEAGSQTLHFPDDSLVAWKYLIYFLHNCTVPRFRGYGTAAVETTYFTALTQAYLLSDKYGLGAFHNEIVRAFLDSAHEVPLPVQQVEGMLELMSTSSPLRSLALQELVRSFEPERCGEGDYATVRCVASANDILLELVGYVRKYQWARGNSAGSFPLHKYGKSGASDSIKKYLVKEEE